MHTYRRAHAHVSPRACTHIAAVARRYGLTKAPRGFPQGLAQHECSTIEQSTHGSLVHCCALHCGTHQGTTEGSSATEATLVRPSRSHLPLLELRPFPLRQIPLTAARNKARTRRTTRRRRAPPTARSRAQLCPQRSLNRPFLSNPRRVHAMQRATKVACNDAACAHANLFRSHRREAWATMQRCEVQECDGAACKCSIQQGNEPTTAPAAMQATCNDAACNTQHATIQQYSGADPITRGERLAVHEDRPKRNGASRECT